MITSKLCEVDVMLLIDMFSTAAYFIQPENCSCIEFPIVDKDNVLFNFIF
jgi:hypothetical protein